MLKYLLQIKCLTNKEGFREVTTASFTPEEEKKWRVAHMFTCSNRGIIMETRVRPWRGGRGKKAILVILQHVFWLKENGISLPGQHTKYRLKSSAHYLNVHLIRLALLAFISPVSQPRWSKWHGYCYMQHRSFRFKTCKVTLKRVARDTLSACASKRLREQMKG